MTQCKNVNGARYHIFSNTYDVKNVTQTFGKQIKNFNDTNLPSNKADCKQHLLRTKCIGILSSQAYMKTLTLLRSQNHCLVEQDGNLELPLFEGNQVPALVNDVIIQLTSEEEDIDEPGTYL